MSVKNVTNVKFIAAVSQWLSTVPSSPIQRDDPILKMKEPKILIQIMKCILSQNFNVHVDRMKMEALDFSDSDEDNPDTNVEWYEHIFQEVLNYLNNKMISRGKIARYIGILDFEELNRGDYFHLSILCFILMEIGFHSYKSAIDIPIISKQTEENQKLLKTFIYDDDDLHCNNFVLHKEVSLLELNNVMLKEDLRLESTKFRQARDKLTNVIKDLDNKENEIHGLNEKISKMLEEHTKVIKDLKLKNKGLMLESEQLKQELSNDSNYSYHKSEPRSLVKFENIHEFCNHDKVLEWEYKVLSELVRHVYTKN